jgi:hypothetical protein
MVFINLVGSGLSGLGIEDKLFHPWTVSASDVAAQDWKLVDVKDPEKEPVTEQVVPETPGR